MKNAISWFEIPVLDFKRAKQFYTTVFATEITDYPMADMEYGVFAYDEANQGVGGALMKMKGGQPTTDGPTIYFNGGEDLSVPLAKVEAAGGTILMPKTAIGENGFMAQCIDTEGNRIAIHSMS